MAFARSCVLMRGQSVSCGTPPVKPLTTTRRRFTIRCRPMDEANSKHLDMVLRYHRETKHHLFRYARALGYLDWDNQPNPFRRYSGAPVIPLPILSPHEEPVSPPYNS